ncbi:hypothetical protein FA13DRAFT_937664 [Coprinellus micaceus]|uniref:Uncharacterized protein n=1 Tax=Coprinellus micaceus TaxID=71717 RepID=A0A4Y7T007_COPMI|nr:hypothetical protein FA13DRAFT_937664 [Coprinellus micaceus]
MRPRCTDETVFVIPALLSNDALHPSRIRAQRCGHFRTRTPTREEFKRSSSINTSKLRAAQVPPKDVLRDIKRTTWLSGSSYFDQALLHYPNRKTVTAQDETSPLVLAVSLYGRVMEGALGVKGREMQVNVRRMEHCGLWRRRYYCVGFEHPLPALIFSAPNRTSQAPRKLPPLTLQDER